MFQLYNNSMNYYEPKQRAKDRRWDYTRNGAPTGYCREYRELDSKLFPISEAEKEEYRGTAHKHHTNGHANELEARECYKEYMLDHKLRLNGTMANEQRKCQVCGEWTQKFAELGISIFTLCDKHNNREEVDKLFEPPDMIWSSW